MVVPLFPIKLSRLVAAVLAVSGILWTADNERPKPDKAGGAKTGDKSSANYNIPLWPEGKAPLALGTGPLDNPFLTVFLPPEGKRNGGSVVIAPGGSNIMLMYGGEGVDIAERYNTWGVNACVLTYRMSPKYGADARVLDAQRAV